MATPMQTPVDRPIVQACLDVAAALVVSNPGIVGQVWMDDSKTQTVYMFLIDAIARETRMHIDTVEEMVVVRVDDLYVKAGITAQVDLECFIALERRLARETNEDAAEAIRCKMDELWWRLADEMRDKLNSRGKM